MKLLGKTKDKAIGSLLRAYVSRPTNPHQECTDFDPDFASSYVEGRLTPSARGLYEAHLSECRACRTGVVTLMRLADAELRSPAPAGSKGRSSRLAVAEGWLHALSRPQWAMAAAAVVVLAISLPLLLTRNQANSPYSRMADEMAAPGRPAGETAPAKPVSGPAVPAESGDITADKRLAITSKPEEKTGEKTPPSAVSLDATNQPAQRDDRAGAQDLQKTEGKPQVQGFDQVQPKAEIAGGVAQAPAPPAQAPSESQLAKKDSDRDQQQQKDTARTVEPKAAAASEAEAYKEKKKAEEIAPPAPRPESARVAEPSRPLGRSRAQLGLRDSSANESVPARSIDREIRGKKFLLKDGTWTDKDYNPDRDLPTITLIRDSNVYKELLAKRSGLKPYLDRFAESERAIIVYKGVVYKLIPQSGDK